MSLPKVTSDLSPDAVSLKGFYELVGTRTGLRVRDKDRASISNSLTRRCRELKISVPDYLQLLRTQKVEEAEWMRLMPLLTNGESYFERDKSQFELLKKRVLPELIESRRAAGERTLRLWSAGCSTGEEAYSLAMIVDSMLPLDWNATILGTDINTEALQKAQGGVYGEWSFRGVEPATLDAFFRPVAGGRQISKSLRKRVTFEFCNLSSSDWPNEKRGLSDMDLILCRNVLIYFQRPVIAEVLARFTDTLRGGGFLLTGHAELHDQNVAPLRTRLFPESAIYQKADKQMTDRASGKTRPVLSDNPSRIPDVSTRSAASIKKPVSPRLMPSPGTTPRPRVETDASKANTKTADAWCADARRYADAGQHDRAVECCRRAIQTDASCVNAYLIWAQTCEEQGHSSEAKNLLRKVIYLMPSKVEAYLELAAIYEREGEDGRARQMRVAALELLRTATPDTVTPSNVALIQHLQDRLNEDNSALPTPTPGAPQ